MTKNPNGDQWIIGADFNNKRIDYFLKKKLFHKREKSYL